MSTSFSQARVVDDGAPHGATVSSLPLQELGGGPGTLAIAGDAGDGGAGSVLENVSLEGPTEEKDKEMLSSGDDAPRQSTDRRSAASRSPVGGEQA